MREKPGGVASASSHGVVVVRTHVSERASMSGWQVVTRSSIAALWRGCRIDRALSVQILRFEGPGQGPGFNSMSPARRMRQDTNNEDERRLEFEREMRQDAADGMEVSKAWR